MNPFTKDSSDREPQVSQTQSPHEIVEVNEILKFSRGLKVWIPLVALLMLSFFSGSKTACAQEAVETLMIPPAVERDLAMTVNSGDRVKGSLSITGAAENDINFWVTDPTGETILNLGRVSHGKDFEFQATRGGDHILHFDNSFSTRSSKIVTLTYHAERSLIPGTPPETFFLIIGLAIAIAALTFFVERRKGPSSQVFSKPSSPVAATRDLRYVEYLGKLEELKTRGGISEETYLKLKDDYWSKLEGARPPASSPVQPPEAEPPVGKFCLSCGASLSAHAAFCNKCGTKQ